MRVRTALRGPWTNYSIAAPCVHLAAHAVSCVRGRAVHTDVQSCWRILTASVSFGRIRRSRQRRMRRAFVGDRDRFHNSETITGRAIVAGTAVAAHKRKRLGDQRAFRVQCEGLSQMQNGVRGGGKIGAPPGMPAVLGGRC